MSVSACSDRPNGGHPGGGRRVADELLGELAALAHLAAPPVRVLPAALRASDGASLPLDPRGAAGRRRPAQGLRRAYTSPFGGSARSSAAFWRVAGAAGGRGRS